MYRETVLSAVRPQNSATHTTCDITRPLDRTVYIHVHVHTFEWAYGEPPLYNIYLISRLQAHFSVHRASLSRQLWIPLHQTTLAPSLL
jgi:hypothetical protein